MKDDVKKMMENAQKEAHKKVKQIVKEDKSEQKEKKEDQQDRPAIGIFTNFTGFNPGYSLTGIVRDQCIMLDEYGHDVYLFTNEECPADDLTKKRLKFPANVKIVPIFPQGHLDDYQTAKDFADKHMELAQKVAALTHEHIEKFKIKFAFTHDWIFTGWNLPYSVAIHMLKDKVNIKWLHWIHSTPNPPLKDWWYIKRYGPDHKIIFPNQTERTRVAEAYRGDHGDVRIIPHIKDPRIWFDFTEEAKRFIRDFPLMMTADALQVYPASSDRLFAKRIDIPIRIFGEWKKLGLSVCLVIANQWARPEKAREEIDKYLNLGQHYALIPDKELIFTSRWESEFEDGLTQPILRDLMLLSNIFIYPTREESFGLVGPEAALNGCFMVLNRSLQMMCEVFDNTGLYLDFGSHHNIAPRMDFESPDITAFQEYARLIAGRCAQDYSFQTKTLARIRYNYNTLYRRCYDPIMAESALWKGGWAGGK